jgi:phage-related protein
MQLRDAAPKKTLVWIGSSKKDLIAMPIAMRKEFGVALDIAQQGLSPEGAKQLKGKAAGATQLSKDYRGDTYRAVYTVELEGSLYVLHSHGTIPVKTSPSMWHRHLQKVIKIQVLSPCMTQLGYRA